MGCQVGKKLFDYMNDTIRMIHRVPNLGANRKHWGTCGCNAEKFDFLINLMFPGAMLILEGEFGLVIKAGRCGAKGRINCIPYIEPCMALKLFATEDFDAMSRTTELTEGKHEKKRKLHRSDR